MGSFWIMRLLVGRRRKGTIGERLATPQGHSVEACRDHRRAVGNLHEDQW